MISLFLSVTIVDQEFANFLPVAKFRGVHVSSYAQTSLGYVI